MESIQPLCTHMGPILPGGQLIKINMTPPESSEAPGTEAEVNKDIQQLKGMEQKGFEIK